jgi:hypothetical protein
MERQDDHRLADGLDRSIRLAPQCDDAVREIKAYGAHRPALVVSSAGADLARVRFGGDVDASSTMPSAVRECGRRWPEGAPAHGASSAIASTSR